MDEKTREKMALAIEKAVLSLGEATYEDGMKKTVKLLEYLTNGIRSIQTPDGQEQATETVLEQAKELSVAWGVA